MLCARSTSLNSNPLLLIFIPFATENNLRFKPEACFFTHFLLHQRNQIMDVFRCRRSCIDDEVSVPWCNLCAAYRRSLKAGLVYELSARFTIVMVVFEDTACTWCTEMPLGDAVLHKVAVVSTDEFLYCRISRAVPVKYTVIKANACKMYAGKERLHVLER